MNVSLHFKHEIYWKCPSACITIHIMIIGQQPYNLQTSHIVGDDNFLIMSDRILFKGYIYIMSAVHLLIYDHWIWACYTLQGPPSQLELMHNICIPCWALTECALTVHPQLNTSL